MNDAVWSIARRFLERHGRAPSGSSLPPEILQVMLVGIWAGARLALLEPQFGAALAAAGNSRGDVVFTSLRDGFETEFGDRVSGLDPAFRHSRGFPPKAASRQAEPLGAEDAMRAVEAAIAWLRRAASSDAPEDRQ